MMWDFILTTLIIVIFVESVLRAVSGDLFPKRREYVWIVIFGLVAIGASFRDCGQFIAMPRFWQWGIFWIIIQGVLWNVVKVGVALLVIEFTARATGAILMAIRGIVTKVFGKDKK